MRKVDDGKKKKKEKRRKEKIMLFLVATNVVASRPAERRPTGTPHARANYCRLCVANVFPPIRTKHYSWLTGCFIQLYKISKFSRVYKG